jgi:hypothetical protein
VEPTDSIVAEFDTRFEFFSADCWALELVREMDMAVKSA